MLSEATDAHKASCFFSVEPSLIEFSLYSFFLPPLPLDPPAESADTSEEQETKKAKRRRTEARLRLLAVGQKIKHVLTSG